MDSVCLVSSCTDELMRAQVQIGLLILWLVVVAVHRACDGVHDACIFLWSLTPEVGSWVRARDCDSFTTESEDRVRVSGGAASGAAMTMEECWEHLLHHLEDWWDNRSSRSNPKAPNFKHKRMRRARWIDNRQTPEWARARFED